MLLLSSWKKTVTPDGWTCIDGTLYFEDGKTFMAFSHSFEDAIDGSGNADGDFCLLEISPDLSESIGEPKVMFSPKDTVWAKPVPFAKAEFGIDGDCYFSDGPSFIKSCDNNLYMTFSSWGKAGYAVGVARSESGKVDGPWILQEEPLYPENGGHGMFFHDLTENLKFTLHYPNDKLNEHPCFWNVVTENEELHIK